MAFPWERLAADEAVEEGDFVEGVFPACWGGEVGVVCEPVGFEVDEAF